MPSLQTSTTASLLLKETRNIGAREDADDIVGVVLRVLHDAGRTDGHGVDLGGDVGVLLESLAADGEADVLDHATALAHHLGGIGGRGELLLIAGHVLLELGTVGGAGLHLDVNHLDVARLLLLAEGGLQLLILGLELLVRHLDVGVLDRVVGDGSQLDLGLLVLLVESHLGLYLVGEDAVGQQRLILLGQELRAEVLLDEEPVVVGGAHLVELLAVVAGLGLAVGVDKLLEDRNVKASGLLVDERGLREQLVRAIVEDVLEFVLGDGQTELLAVFLHHALGDELLPYLVLQLVELVLAEVVGAHGQFHRILILLKEFLEVLHVDFLAKDLTYLLAVLTFDAIAGTESLLGNERK